MKRLAWFVLFAGCASAPSTGSVRPDEMSAAAHEAEAREVDKAAAWHEKQYDPYAGRPTGPCVPAAGSTTSAPCFTQVANPTAEHLRTAEMLRKHAAEHRAASKLLRDAETRACAGVSSEDRDLSPFFHRESIVRVEPLREPDTVGARVVFRPIEGLTPEFLQRLVDCHLARNAALGDEALGLEDDPLGLPAIKAQAMRVWDGIAIEVRSSKPETALKILARANALVQ